MMVFVFKMVLAVALARLLFGWLVEPDDYRRTGPSWRKSAED